ncbi:asparagine synthase (glutamine-hydrolysing) [Rhizobiales bacterium GAS113]|nr:asparagine synthase (glutamine-hydrolysing) [Rhizobiales bacterium GAS113]
MDPTICGAIAARSRQELGCLSQMVAEMCEAICPSCHQPQRSMPPGTSNIIFAKIIGARTTSSIRSLLYEQPSALFTGTIYNKSALLDALGFGRGDLATPPEDEWLVTHAIQRWGVPKALKEISGKFALAFWDAQERRLVLASDRSTELNLYYAKIGTILLFSSDFRAFKPFHRRLEIDRDALSMLVRYGYLPAPYTIYREARKLPASHFAVFLSDLSESMKVSEGRYAESLYERHSIQSLGQLSDLEATDRLDTLLLNGITSRVGNSSVGAFMSSGFDSTLVAAMLQKATGRRIPTFTIGFQGVHFDEAPAARLIAEHLGTTHQEIYLDDRMLADAVLDIPKTYPEPLADSSQLPTMILARSAKQLVDTVFSGDGGDCILGEYTVLMPIYRALLRAQSLSLPVRRALCNILTVLGGIHPQLGSSIAGYLAKCLKIADPGRDMFLDVLGLLRSSDLGAAGLTVISRVSDPALFVPGSDEPDIGWHDGFALGRAAAAIDQLVKLDAEVTLPPVIRKTVSACEHASLNVAMPFMDRELLDFCSTLPRRLKYRRDRSKWLLRQVAYRYLPKALLDLPKRGFSIWLSPILRSELKDWAEHLLNEKRLESEGFFDPKRVRREWQLHVDGLGDFREERLWSILMFQQWLDTFASY